jgi:hypothetical protein
VKPGNTHHLCLFEWNENGKTKRDSVFVPLIEALRRLRKGEPVIQRTPPPDHPTIPADARFLLSLSNGEMILADVKGQPTLLVFKTAAATTGQMFFVSHNDARRSADQELRRFNPNALPLLGSCSMLFRRKAPNGDSYEERERPCSKVTVDLLGRIRWAND